MRQCWQTGPYVIVRKEEGLEENDKLITEEKNKLASSKLTNFYLFLLTLSIYLHVLTYSRMSVGSNVMALLQNLSKQQIHLLKNFWTYKILSR